ncbi:MAG: hypothetical protein M0P11_03250 [Anaerolineaceae bacterium]|nr:hypothetical protein [Anaerolineaceae bacterium]
MRNDYLLASSTVNTKPDVLYQAFPRDELPTFNQGRLERVIDMLNRAWDISPRLSIASFELALPHGGSDDPGGICQLMGQYFRTLSQLIQLRGPEYGQPTMGNSPTRLWGLWSGDTMAGRADSQIRVSCLLDSDACLMWQTPGLTWQSVLATTFQTAYRVVHGHRPEIPSLGVRLGADWLQSVDGYGDFAGFKAVFRQLSEHCRSHDRAFGCGLVPNRVVDLEFYPVDSFIFPLTQISGRARTLTQEVVP